ncbi:MAG: 16S rRNA (uracil(1498)-N(3))-methyltransferase [Bdellovibrionota bacterium]
MTDAMNLILFDANELQKSTLEVRDRRARHIVDIHRARLGDILNVGQIDGLQGTGKVIEVSSSPDDPVVKLEIELKHPSPPPLSLTLFLALPRPKFLRKTLQTVATLGVKDIYLINSARVEKVYWSCAQLSETEVRESFLLGLEQARDTLLPRLHLKNLFKPFVEDELPSLISRSEAYVAHPSATDECPRARTGPLSLAIGPEGGFIPYEIDHLIRAGMKPVSIGPRILKVETAVTALISRLC